MQTFTETQQKGLIKKFHAMLAKAGVGADGKEAILSSFRVDSTKKMSVSQLIAACEALNTLVNPKSAELDAHRKRLIASIGGWLRAMNKKENIAIIKAIACRASEKESFNAIPAEQLRSLYNAFNKKRKDLKMVEQITVDELDILTLSN